MEKIIIISTAIGLLATIHYIYMIIALNQAKAKLKNLEDQFEDYKMKLLDFTDDEYSPFTRVQIWYGLSIFKIYVQSLDFHKFDSQNGPQLVDSEQKPLEFNTLEEAEACAREMFGKTVNITYSDTAKVVCQNEEKE